jgi:hypothetical protein
MSGQIQPNSSREPSNTCDVKGTKGEMPPEPDTKTMKRRAVIGFLLLVAAVAVVAIGVVALWHPSTGVDVTVVNRGTGTITEVEVQVLPNVYPLGRLAPGTSGSGRLTIAGETVLAVEFRDSEGMWHEVKADVHLKRGYRGTVTIELERNAISRVEQHLEPGRK